MPPVSLLKMYRGLPGDRYTPNRVNGAFWMNNGEPLPEFWQIQDEVANLKQTAFMFSGSGSDAEFEAEVAHLGNMITRYSDAKVDQFDRRLQEAQKLGFEYLQEAGSRNWDSKLMQMRTRVINANLELGYEVRESLKDTLSKLSGYGLPLSVDIEGDPFNVSLIRNASKTFPSDWNSVLADKLIVNFKANQEASYFDASVNEVFVTAGKEKFNSYPSLEEAQRQAAQNPQLYMTHVEMVHELAHKFERIQPLIVKASRGFINRRGLGSGFNFDSSDVIQDHFANEYVGQLWGKHHTEVFSMGVESTILGTQGSLIGLALPRQENQKAVRHHRADIEHRNLTAGLLAAIPMPINNDNKGRPVETIFGLWDPNNFKLF